MRQLRRRRPSAVSIPNVWFHNVERVAAETDRPRDGTYVSNIYKYYVAYLLIQGEYLERRELKKKTGSVQ